MPTDERPTRGHGVLESFLADRRARIANALIPPTNRTGRILDIGCGSYPTFLAGTEFTEKWGVDQLISSESSVEFPVGGHAQLRPYDANRDRSLPFDAEMFTAVTMLAVFEHIAVHRLVPLLIEVRRVLATGGVFIMTTPAHWTGWILTVMARLNLVSGQEILEHQGSYTRGYILDRLEAAGFDRRRMRAGSFELFANNWATATK